jgi:argininosuccinate synthase
VEASAKKPYSMDRNLLHISYEAGILEDPWFDPTTDDNKDMYKLTVDPADAPDTAEYVELDFEAGDCVAINGRKLSAGDAMKELNALAGKNGIGRVDIVENRFVGMKSRGVYETPGGTILLHARKQMETLTLDRDLEHLRDSLIPKYGELIYNGFWYAPEREALQAFFDKSQEKVTGTIRLKLFKGNITTVGRKSPYSLYDEDIASMEGVMSDYNPDDATGFIRLQGLRLRARAKAQGAPECGPDPVLERE